MPILAFLGQAMMWIAGALVARWVIIKVFVIGLFVVVLPWVLKDGVNWFWDATDTSRAIFLQYLQTYFAELLSFIDPNIVINITSIGGYIAEQIGLADYAAIIFTALGVCWGYKIGARFL